MRADVQSARAAVYADNYLALVRLAAQLVGDLESAEEVVQDVFASWAPTTTPTDPLHYLRTAVLNRSRSVLRHRRIARITRFGPAAPSTTEDPEAGLIVQERRRILLRHIDRLPCRQREVIVLRFYEDLTVGEIAALLGIRPGAVSTSLSRALATLARILGAEDHDR